MNVFPFSRRVASSALAGLAAWGVLVTGSAPRLPAQAAPLDLAAALQLARASGPLRKIADARETAGRGRVGESGQWPNPSIEWRRENLGSSLQPDIFATTYIPLDLTGRRLALRQATGAGRQRVQADAVASSATYSCRAEASRRAAS